MSATNRFIASVARIAGRNAAQRQLVGSEADSGEGDKALDWAVKNAAAEGWTVEAGLCLFCGAKASHVGYIPDRGLRMAWCDRHERRYRRARGEEFKQRPKAQTAEHVTHFSVGRAPFQSSRCGMEPREGAPLLSTDWSEVTCLRCLRFGQKGQGK